MAKPIKRTTEEALEDALAYYQAGKSVRECEKLTGINFMKVEREAKKRGLVKGSVLRLEESMVRDRVELLQLPVTVQARVTEDVDKQLKGMEFYATNARKAVKMGLVALSKDQTPMNTKTVLDAMKTGMIVEGLVPFYPNAAVINNAQLNNASSTPVGDYLSAIENRLNATVS